MTARIAVGGILHETHTFAPSRTGMSDFEALGVFRGSDLLGQRGAPSALGGILDRLASSGCQVAPLLAASAMPGGTVTRAAYRALRGSFLAELERALPLDGVALSLHGAMVAEGQLDCEGEILAEVRRRVGPGCPVAVTLDMHGNASPAMVRAADVLVGFHHNPHTDAYERGVETAEIVERLLRQPARVSSALARPPLVLSALHTWTEREPLCAVHQAARAYDGDPRVLNISVMGGFAYADTPHSGVSVIVSCAGDAELARQTANRVARQLALVAWQHRRAAADPGLTPAEAVARAIWRAMQSADRPTVLADVGDNIGGGSPGDGTVLLRALLDMGAQGAVVVLADGQAAAAAHQAGTGAALALAVGGKSDSLHGDPLQVEGVVESLSDGRFDISGKDHFANLYGSRVDMGPCAVLRCQGVRILLTTRRTPPGDLNQLRSQGIEPQRQSILVVKSAVAFRGAYEPIAGEILEVNTPGLCASDLSRFDYQHLPRPVYPLDGEAVEFA